MVGAVAMTLGNEVELCKEVLDKVVDGEPIVRDNWVGGSGGNGGLTLLELFELGDTVFTTGEDDTGLQVDLVPLFVREVPDIAP